MESISGCTATDSTVDVSNHVERTFYVLVNKASHLYFEIDMDNGDAFGWTDDISKAKHFYSAEEYDSVLAYYEEGRFISKYTENCVLIEVNCRTLYELLDAKKHLTCADDPLTVLKKSLYGNTGISSDSVSEFLQATSNMGLYELERAVAFLKMLSPDYLKLVDRCMDAYATLIFNEVKSEEKKNHAQVIACDFRHMQEILDKYK